MRQANRGARPFSPLRQLRRHSISTLCPLRRQDISHKPFDPPPTHAYQTIWKLTNCGHAFASRTRHHNGLKKRHPFSGKAATTRCQLNNGCFSWLEDQSRRLRLVARVGFCAPVVTGTTVAPMLPIQNTLGVLASTVFRGPCKSYIQGLNALRPCGWQYVLPRTRFGDNVFCPYGLTNNCQIHVGSSCARHCGFKVFHGLR